MLKQDKEEKIKNEVLALLAKYLKKSPKSAHAEPVDVSSYPRGKEDIILDYGKHIILVEYISSSAKAPLFSYWLDATKKHSDYGKKASHLLVVPYMGETGRKFCEEKHISWLDLSGNAQIMMPDFFVHVEGKPNLFKEVGRPSDVFAPKSSRITRQLLMFPAIKIIQRELARKTGLDEGFTSRVVRKLLDNRLITKDGEGRLHVPDPARLLESWHDTYDFNKHLIIKGHIAEQSSEALFFRIANILKQHGINHAATGLAAAWNYDHFASYRIVSFYVARQPDQGLTDIFGFVKDERGANTWFIVPNDEGVFQGAQELEGITCVHPIQVYLDLKGHPERASEAAESLRKHFLNWSPL